MSRAILRSYRFRKEREQNWRELERLIAVAERKSPADLDSEQLVRLPVLYRAALSSLSVAREISLDKNLITYLEGLATRAFGFVYGSRHSVVTSLSGFFAHRFPSLVWSIRLWVLLAMMLLAFGTVGGFSLTMKDDNYFHSLVSDRMAAGRSPLSTREELLEVLKETEQHQIDDLSAFTSFLFTHNARIGLSCFGVGFAAGVPVALLVVLNGLSLGAFAAIYSAQGLGLEFWAWVLPHGVTELLAVCLCAGAGFQVGFSWLFPGRRSRRANLVREGRRAAAVVVGSTLLFLGAALFEGFFRPLVHNDGIRTAVAAASFAVWIIYFTPILRPLNPEEQ